jgi:hypothetical protein
VLHPSVAANKTWIPLADQLHLSDPSILVYSCKQELEIDPLDQLHLSQILAAGRSYNIFVLRMMTMHTLLAQDDHVLKIDHIGNCKMKSN